MQGVRPVQAAGRHVPLSQTLGSSANASIAPAPLFCSSRRVAVNPGHCVEARAAGPVAAQPPPLHHFSRAPPCISSFRRARPAHSGIDFGSTTLRLQIWNLPSKAPLISNNIARSPPCLLVGCSRAFPSQALPLANSWAAAVPSPRKLSPLLTRGLQPCLPLASFPCSQFFLNAY